MSCGGTTFFTNVYERFYSVLRNQPLYQDLVIDYEKLLLNQIASHLLDALKKFEVFRFNPQNNYLLHWRHVLALWAV